MRTRMLYAIQRMATQQGLTLPRWLCSPDYNPRQFYILEDRKLVFISVPKVACSSILSAIASSYQVKLQSALHSDPFWQIVRGTLSAQQQTYDKFAFVRNPFARIVSCYKHKILRVRMQSQTEQVPYLFQKFLPLESTFDEFINVISRVPDCHAEQHFKSQYAILYEGGRLLPDWVGRFETLAASWAEIAQKYRFEQALPKLRSTAHLPDTPQDYRTYYTRPLVKLVYRRYQKDIEAFGYASVYQELLAFVDKR